MWFNINVPSNPTTEWLLGILIAAIVALATFIGGLVRFYLKNYVPKELYNRVLQMCNDFSGQITESNQIRAKDLDNIYKILGELNATQELILQALSGINNTLQLLIFAEGKKKGGQDE